MTGLNFKNYEMKQKKEVVICDSVRSSSLTKPAATKTSNITFTTFDKTFQVADEMVNRGQHKRIFKPCF